MNQKSTTVVLLIVITFLALWRSGKLQTWLNQVTK